MPPYPFGGIGYQGGATMPMRNGFQEPSRGIPPERACRWGPAGRRAGARGERWGERSRRCSDGESLRYRCAFVTSVAPAETVISAISVYPGSSPRRALPLGARAITIRADDRDPDGAARRAARPCRRVGRPCARPAPLPAAARAAVAAAGGGNGPGVGAARAARLAVAPGRPARLPGAGVRLRDPGRDRPRLEA